MSWWKYVGGLSPGPAAIPNPANPVAWQRVYYERGQPVEDGRAQWPVNHASGSCRGRYHTDRQPGEAARCTARCPDAPPPPASGP